MFIRALSALGAAALSLVSISEAQTLRTQTINVPNYSALKALNPSSFTADTVILVGGKRGGTFVRTNTDLADLKTNDPQECVFVEDSDGSGGWLRQSWHQGKREISASWCGAVSGDATTSVQTANVTAFNAAYVLLGSAPDPTQDDQGLCCSPKGGILNVAGVYYLNGQIGNTWEHKGVWLKGLGTRNRMLGQIYRDFQDGTGSRIDYRPGPSSLIFSHTSGHALNLQAHLSKVSGIEIIGSDARYDGTAGDGIHCEGVDAVDSDSSFTFTTYTEWATPETYACELSNVVVARHPEDGVDIVGNYGFLSSLKDFNVSANRRYGIKVDTGSVEGRTNSSPGFHGQITIANGINYENGSHGLVWLGNTSGVLAYRGIIKDVDSRSNAILNAAANIADANWVISAENVTISHSGIAGLEDNRSTGLATEHLTDCIAISGQSIVLMDNRYIACDVPIALAWHTVRPTRAVTIIGGTVSQASGTDRPVVVAADNPASEVFVFGFRPGEYTHIISPSSSTISNSWWHDGTRLRSTTPQLLSRPLTVDVANGGNSALVANTADEYLYFSGGTALAGHGTIELFGGSNSTQPSRVRVRSVDSVFTNTDATQTYASVTSRGVTASQFGSNLALNIVGDQLGRISFGDISVFAYGKISLTPNSPAALPAATVVVRLGSSEACVVESATSVGTVTCAVDTSANIVAGYGTDGHITVVVSSDTNEVYISNRATNSPAAADYWVLATNWNAGRITGVDTP